MGGGRGRQDRVVDGVGGTKRGHQALLDRVVDGLGDEEMGRGRDGMRKGSSVRRF